MTLVGHKFRAILQMRVDRKRSIWLAARDKFNSGNPVYIQGVPESLGSGDVVVGIVADEMGTVFFDSTEPREGETNGDT